MIVLDTSALIFWTLDPQNLSTVAEEAILTADLLQISAISLWEIGIKARRGKLDLPLSLRQYAELLVQVRRVEIVPVTSEIWIRNVELEWTHRDPADRTIVAMATMLDAPLLTSDRVIRDFYPLSVW